jgi:ABC-type transport system involved in multi-copper enzyme maturation permease subunit
LVVSVVTLPLIIVDDGTANGLIQILITYNLGIITTILGLATLWLACGSLARDIEECQMQMVVVKPIARWQVWLGKWLGIMALNGLLLGLSGITLYFLIEWRAGKLSAKQQEILRSQLLVARASKLPEEAKSANKIIDETVETELKLRLKNSTVTGADIEGVRKEIREQLKSEIQVVPSGRGRYWTIDLSDLPQSLRDLPVYLRVKFSVSRYSPAPVPYPTYWEVGPRDAGNRQSVTLMLTTDTFTEIPVPPGLLDKNGRLTVVFGNVTDVNVLFSTEEGMELLYHESSFGVNFLRGILILYFWLGLLAVLGLTSASFLSVPVAAFLSLTTLGIALASGTIGQVLKEGSFVGGYSGASNPTIWDHLFLPLLRGMLWTVDLALNYSPIDSLSAGRSITWFLLGKAFVMILIATGGVLAAVGVICFTRRELAAAQSS